MRITSFKVNNREFNFCDVLIFIEGNGEYIIINWAFYMINKFYVMCHIIGFILGILIILLIIIPPWNF
jgi:hypothetical protein